MTWTLVIYAVARGGLGKGVSITAIPGFSSLDTCNEAGVKATSLKQSRIAQEMYMEYNCIEVN